MAKLTAAGKANPAIPATEPWGKARQEAADRPVELQGERSHLEAESRRVAAQTGPARFLAAQLGTDAETVFRGWWRSWCC